MGIPSYFNHILQNHPNIIINKKHVKCDYFFIDANSLIYDCIYSYETPCELSDETIYEMVCEHIQRFIDFLEPTKKVYVCFDGIPPYPKMVQQRQRRFKSVFTNKILNKKGKLWNTNKITPGTEFMNNLDKYMTKKYDNHPLVIFSGPNVPGEGEHKICDIIRGFDNERQDKTKIIYGLDADLIMLGLLLSCDFKNVYLYKETKYFEYISKIDKNENYYFNLSKLGLEIGNLLHEPNIKQSVYDYIFMCFLCGNDFLPHLPSINIRNNGILYLINSYKLLNSIHKISFISPVTKHILWKNINCFVTYLMKQEDERIEENIQWKLKFRHKIIPQNDDERLNLLPCFDVVKELYLKNNIAEYNSYVLNAVDNTAIKNICLDYLKVLEWTWHYYNGKNITNNICAYEHVHGPLFKDLIRFIPISNTETISGVTTSKNIQPILPATQLLFVLPVCDHDTLIPLNNYDKLKFNIYNEFPELLNNNHDIDYFLCKYFWEGHMKLEHIDIHKLNSIVGKYIGVSNDIVQSV